MKKIFLFTIMLLVNAIASSQVVGSGYTSLVSEVAGNAASNAALMRWKKNKDIVLKALDNFKLEYNKRYLTYDDSYFEFKKIENRINKLLQRTNYLQTLNNKILIDDDNKKENSKAIAAINDAITNYANSLTHFSLGGTTPRTIRGEILNLRQDFEIYLDEQSRKLDVLEQIVNTIYSKQSKKINSLEKKSQK